MIFSRFLLIPFFLALPVYSELPPDVYIELKEQAEELLVLKVTEVTSLGLYYACMEEFLVSATVEKVERTSYGFVVGDAIRFQSYTIDSESDECIGWVGPGPPFLVEPEQCLKAYLNIGTADESVFQLAAYGQSLELIDCESISRCQDSEILVEIQSVEASSHPMFCCKTGEGRYGDFLTSFLFEQCYEI